MPLTKENRHLLEVAIMSYLKTTGETTSKDIYEHLKSRGFLALRGTKQVAMICLGFQKKGALLSRDVKVRDRLRIYKKKCWRVNPNFYEEHPNQSKFTFPPGTLGELRKIRKRRMKVI